MITKEDFLQEFNGHGNAYSSFMVINIKIDDLIKALNDIDPNMTVGSGTVSETEKGSSIYFEICKRTPDLIYNITEKLKCKGFADIGGWYGDGYMVAANCGKDYDDYTAVWADEDQPCRRDYDVDKDLPDEEIYWDAFVEVTDKESGESFNTGEGCICYESMKYWRDIVEKH